MTASGHHFNATVLREYDIRGVVGDTLTVDDATALGRAFGSVVVEQSGSRICVGYDGRHSSLDMEAALVEGLISTGINVDRIGRGPTPMLYFATVDSGADGGIMVTGSHNPPKHNGFKIMHGPNRFMVRPFRISADGLRMAILLPGLETCLTLLFSTDISIGW